MARREKYVTAAALCAVLAGTSSVSYVVARGDAAYGIEVHSVEVPPAVPAKLAEPAGPRVVRPGEHVVAAPGFELWLTGKGKHWTAPQDPRPRFRDVTDGGIDLTRPGVTLQTTGTANGGHYLSGLYYGGRGTASYAEVETASGTVRGDLIELPGNPGWGVWYAPTTIPPGTGTTSDTIGTITVRGTEGEVYARLER